MPNSFYLLDTFTKEKFRGNPTPVCVMQEFPGDAKLLSLAREFNSPVTAFIIPSGDPATFLIRYFTIKGEIPACGHATLGAASVVFTGEELQQLHFITAENLQLKARREKEIIYLQYPKYNHNPFDAPASMLQALGTKRFINAVYNETLQTAFFELEDEKEVRSIQPDFRMLENSSDDVKEVVIMSRSEDREHDVVLRSFCPWIGIDEDPVTGSIHSVLAGYWQSKTGKDFMTIYQASERGGTLYVNALETAVEIGGMVQVVASGRLEEEFR